MRLVNLIASAAPSTPPAFALQKLAVGLNLAVGVDDLPQRGVLVSVNYPSGEPYNFEVVHDDGTHEPFSSLHGFTDEVYFVSIRDDLHTGTSLGGFRAGDIFSGTGVPGEIARLSADGTVSPSPSATPQKLRTPASSRTPTL